jgi:hypothetical protein
LNDAVLIVRVGSRFILFGRKSKQKNAADARLFCITRKFNRIVDRQVVLAGHGTDFGPNLLARTHKNRVDHGFRREPCFTDQIAKPLGAPEPAHAIGWKCHFFSGSEEPFLPPEGTHGADVFQRKRESKAAFNAETKIHLTHFEAQADAVRIIANLCCRPLEN